MPYGNSFLDTGSMETEMSVTELGIDFMDTELSVTKLRFF